MKVLSFLARRFAWSAHERNLESEDKSDASGEMRDVLVLFVQLESCDEGPARDSVFFKVFKHAKWLAKKRGFKNVLLHSFAHLGGDNADAAFAKQFLLDLDARLTIGGYHVEHTPFGHFCEWQLDVHGESLAKVWKEFRWSGLDT